MQSRSRKRQVSAASTGTAIRTPDPGALAGAPPHGRTGVPAGTEMQGRPRQEPPDAGGAETRADRAAAVGDAGVGRSAAEPARRGTTKARSSRAGSVCKMSHAVCARLAGLHWKIFSGLVSELYDPSVAGAGVCRQRPDKLVPNSVAICVK